MIRKYEKRLEAEKLKLADQMSPGTISYHIRSVVDLLVRLYDLVAGGHYRYSDAELPSTNQRMNSEIEKWTIELNRLKKVKLCWTPPFADFDIDVVCDTWFQVHKQRVREFRFDVEAVAPVSEGPLRQQCTVFCFQIGKMIDEYEKSKYKYEADQFGWYFRDNQRKESELRLLQDQVFPSEEFEFIGDLKVRLTVKSYYDELRQTYFAPTVISSIILAGALIEALLLEALKADETLAKAAYQKEYPRRDCKELSEWWLSELIDCALATGILPLELRDQMNSVRSFRNFVHISRAANSAIQLGNSYKEICKNALTIVLTHVRIWTLAKRIVDSHAATVSD